MGAVTIAQLATFIHKHWYHIWVPVCVSTAPLLIQLSAMAWEAVQDGLRHWGLVPAWDIWKKLLAPGLRLAQTLGTIWGVNQQMRAPSVSNTYIHTRGYTNGKDRYVKVFMLLMTREMQIKTTINANRDVEKEEFLYIYFIFLWYSSTVSGIAPPCQT